MSRAGSVRQPCGTKKLKNPHATLRSSRTSKREPARESPPASSPPPCRCRRSPPRSGGPAPRATRHTDAVHRAAHRRRCSCRPSYRCRSRPRRGRSPPSGTSAVSSQAVQKEEEEEAAPSRSATRPSPTARANTSRGRLPAGDHPAGGIRRSLDPRPALAPAQRRRDRAGHDQLDPGPAANVPSRSDLRPRVCGLFTS